MGLGTAGDDDVTLVEARDLAADARRRVRGGGDPIAERKAQRLQKRFETQAVTFKECAERYIASHKAGWRNARHAAQWPATLATYAYPVFGDRSAQAVDVGLVMKALEPIWSTKSETASRVRGRIESVLDWATARGYREGENPARWRGHLENLLPKKSRVRRVVHHAALPYADLPRFFASLRQQDGIAPRALEFAILTVTRTSEVLEAPWAEIDLDGQLWTIPPERMKAGKEHRVPLSEPAIAILIELGKLRQSAYVFPGQRAGRPLAKSTLLASLKRMGRRELTVHGFRSCFTDWCSERTNFPAEVREMALAHVIADRVEAAYRRGDLVQKRRQLAEAWARFCTTGPAARGDVVAIGAAR
jgi:integrase